MKYFVKNINDLRNTLDELKDETLPAKIKEAIKKKLENMIPVYLDSQTKDGCCLVFIALNDEQREDVEQILSEYNVGDAWVSTDLLVEEDGNYCWVVENFDTTTFRADFNYESDHCGFVISRLEKNDPFICSWFEDDLSENKADTSVEFIEIKEDTTEDYMTEFDEESNYGYPKTVTELKALARNRIHPLKLYGKVS